MSTHEGCTLQVNMQIYEHGTSGNQKYCASTLLNDFWTHKAFISGIVINVATCTKHIMKLSKHLHHFWNYTQIISQTIMLLIAWNALHACIALSFDEQWLWTCALTGTFSILHFANARPCSLQCQAIWHELRTCVCVCVWLLCPMCTTKSSATYFRTMLHQVGFLSNFRATCSTSRSLALGGHSKPASAQSEPP